MTPITTAWLNERGLLHDARVHAAHIEGPKVRISIDDEWANEHDGSEGSAAGAIVFYDADVVEGDVTGIGGGWISEVKRRADNVVFDFCDRDRLVIRGTAAWEPEVG